MTVTVEQAVTAYTARIRQVRTRAAQLAAIAWQRVDPADVRGSWARAVPRVVQVTAAAQMVGASTGPGYVTAVTAAQGMTAQPAGVLVPSAFAGVASDGRSLTTLLTLAAVKAQRALDQGAAAPQALDTAGVWLGRVVANEVTDAFRVAAGVATVTDRAVSGYVRMLNPPSCSRCAVLAGKFFRWNAGFDRHPQCFPAGVAVSGPQTLAASRRWYEGELVVLATASGQQLSLTGNHPVLTRRGWVPANLLQEGDEVVRSTRPKGATPLVVPDHQQMPALVEDVWRALGVGGLHRMPTAPEDFHGDGQDGEVDVVYADRALGRVLHPALVEQFGEAAFAIRGELAGPLDVERMPVLVDAGHAAQAGGGVGGFGLALPFLGGHLGGAHFAGGARAAAFDAVLGQAALDDVAAHAVLTGQGVFAGTGEVGGGNRLNRQHLVAPRWDAPAGPLTVENRGTYAGRGADLLDRLTGQIELDRLVDVRRVEWSGHVYSLTSVEGWHVANSLIVSNCDCVHIPAAEDTAGDLRTDPAAYFASLTPAEQDRVFTKAGAQAIRDGADIGQVVNARRGAWGMAPAGPRLTDAEARALRGGPTRGRLQARTVFGRQLYTTSEGTTRRGHAFQALARGGTTTAAEETVLRHTRRGLEQRSVHRVRARAPRLMPESIYQIAGTDREEAIRLLRLNGYIT